MHRTSIGSVNTWILALESSIFFFHPEAALWIDHHETTFSTEAARLAFRPDPFHVFVPQAASCPSVIAPLPWFDRAERWQDYVYWADIIDGASSESPKQANDSQILTCSSLMRLPSFPDSASLSALIRAIGLGSATEALDQSELRIDPRPRTSKRRTAPQAPSPHCSASMAVLLYSTSPSLWLRIVGISLTNCTLASDTALGCIAATMRPS